MSREPSRMVKGSVLLVGAAVFFLAVVVGDAEFWWTPLGIGLVYLAAAAATGRDGSYWATAAVLCGWGAGVAWLNVFEPDVFAPAAHVFAVGVGATAAALLMRAGFDVDPLGVGVTALVAGALFMAERHLPDLLGEASTYAALVAVVGAANIGLAVVRVR